MQGAWQKDLLDPVSSCGASNRLYIERYAGGAIRRHRSFLYALAGKKAVRHMEKKYIVLALIGFMAVMIYAGSISHWGQTTQNYSPVSQEQPTDTPAPTPNDTLNAKVDTNAFGVTIYNNGSVDWKDCTTSINAGFFGGGYTEHENIFYYKGPNNWKNFISYSDFVKDDGTRFDISQTKIKSIQVTCTDNGQGNVAAFVKNY